MRPRASQLIRELDRTVRSPRLLPAGPAAELFREAGATVHTGPVAGFTHIWASTYRGRRWLLFLRELVRLPAHLSGLGRTLTGSLRARPLQRLAADPGGLARTPSRRAGRLAPALGSRRRGARSALPGAAPRDAARLHASIAINDDVAALWRVPAAVVPNGIDLERFSPGNRGIARGRLGLPADGKVVSFVGFLYPAKGYRQLLQAAALLRDRGVEATWVVAGGGVRPPRFYASPAGRVLERLGLARDDEAEARALVAELRLGSAVRLLPYIPDVEVVYRASDIVVAPSQGPEIGRSLLEAAATGVAAVGTGSATGGGVLQPGVTTIFARDTGPEAIADAVAALLGDDDARDAMGAAARLHALVTFDPARSAALVVAEYDTVPTKV